MNYAIIGSGKIGTALARTFARKGISVAIANTRGPDSLAPLAKEIGETIIPQTLQDALKADLVILAVPFRAYQDVAQAANDWNGKIVIDAMNAWGVLPEELNGLLSSEVVSFALPGAKVVKAFNHLPAALLASDPSQGEGRRVVFVSSDSEETSTIVADLVDQLGFAPIELGKLHEGGLLLHVRGQTRGPLLLQNLVKFS